jgi:hypothetical protein
MIEHSPSEPRLTADFWPAGPEKACQTRSMSFILKGSID